MTAKKKKPATNRPRQYEYRPTKAQLEAWLEESRKDYSWALENYRRIEQQLAAVHASFEDGSAQTLAHATSEAERYLRNWNEAQANFEGSEQKLTILSSYIDKQKADYEKQVSELNARIREIEDQADLTEEREQLWTVDVYAGSVQ